MKKLILGLVAATAVAAAAPGLASADVSNNGTTNDAYGYCHANHIANFNGDHNGIGHDPLHPDRRADQRRRRRPHPGRTSASTPRAITPRSATTADVPQHLRPRLRRAGGVQANGPSPLVAPGAARGQAVSAASGILRGDGAVEVIRSDVLGAR